MADEYLTAALYGMKRFNEGMSKKVKELMGMEKLIELLNEYEKGDVWDYDEEMGMPYYGWGDDCDYDTYLISKKYGFIKWLVENEKIDLEKLGEKSEYTFIKNGGGEHIIEDVLMLLSIQDEPIEFLVSILK